MNRGTDDGESVELVTCPTRAKLPEWRRRSRDHGQHMHERRLRKRQQALARLLDHVAHRCVQPRECDHVRIRARFV